MTMRDLDDDSFDTAVSTQRSPDPCPTVYKTCGLCGGRKRFWTEYVGGPVVDCTTCWGRGKVLDDE